MKLQYAVLFNVFVVFIVTLIIAPQDHFLENLAYMLLPQAFVILIVSAITRRSSVITGLTIFLALFLALYFSWMVITSQHPLAWVGYIFSLPGAGLGALAFHYIGKSRSLGLSKETMGTVIVSSVGVAINLAIVMYIFVER